MRNTKLLQTLRLMAWERAKGELRSISQAYYPTMENREDDEGIRKFGEMIENLITEVEDRGLIEAVN